MYIFPGLMFFSLSQQHRLGMLGGSGGEGAAGGGADAEAVEGALGEAAPLSTSRSDGTVAGRRVWNAADACGTRHGWVLLGFSAVGFVVMIAGTLTTAGLLASA